MTYPNEAKQSEGCIEEGQILRFPKRPSQAKADWQKSTVKCPSPKSMISLAGLMPRFPVRALLEQLEIDGCVARIVKQSI